MDFKFFAGLLIPVFIMVALVRIAINDMVVFASVWNWNTLIFTIGGALVGTILEGVFKGKEKKKTGIDRYSNK
jgi:hypothetical protein